MKWLIRLLKLGMWSFFLVAMLGAIALGSAYFYLEPRLPHTESLRDVAFQVPLRVYSRDRKLIAEFGEKRRLPLVYSELPEQMIQAFLAAEDNRFFEHPGVDYQGILRAAFQLLLTGEKRQGGSTITMQVARNFFLSRKKTYTRKMNEILLALKIERELDKEKILELYLNKIFMGHRAYGVGAAARVYYGKTVAELDLAQTAMVAGLPKAPSRFNPIANPKRALERRNYVLGQMKKQGYIPVDEYQAALSQPVTASLHAADIELEAPYVAEMVRGDMLERYGEEIYIGGYNVYTTLDSRLQTAANAAVRSALQAYDRRHGYRGVSRHVDLPSDLDDQALDGLLQNLRPTADLRPGLVTKVDKQSIEVYQGGGRRIEIDWEGLAWAQPYKSENRKGAKPKTADQIVKEGDLILTWEEVEKGESHWRLAQVPAVDGALVSLYPDDGAVAALVGGYDFYSSKFNRVTQAKRQPGSGFKAFIYSAALEAGFTPASLINDAPVVFDDPSLEDAWRPENYSGKFFGPTRLRYALTKSRNLVSIRLLRSMGVAHALEHAKRFGFDPDDLPHNLSLALGSGAVTPLQMARGYAILANGGYRVTPYFIDRIADDRDKTLYQAEPARVCEKCPEEETNNGESADETAGGNKAPRAISPGNYYLMNSMMRDVVRRGTAVKARALGRQDLAGKTGTTNEQIDAWFNGFNRSLLAIAWVGFDSAKPLGRGEVGGRAALPAWMAYMKVALKDVQEIPLNMPPGIITVRIDPKTGKRARTNQKDAIFEVFRKENAPSQRAPEDLPIPAAGADAGKPGDEPSGGGSDDPF